MNHEELWRSALGEIEFEVSRANFATWFKETSINGIEDGVAVVAVPNAFAKEWLERKFHKQILRSLRANSPDVRNATYIVRPAGNVLTLETKKKAAQPEMVDDQLDFKEFSVDKETNLNPRYTFDTFVVGSFNEFANAASISITKNFG